MKKPLIILFVSILICTVSSCSNQKNKSSNIQSSSESFITTSETMKSETSENTESVVTEQTTVSGMSSKTSAIKQTTTEKNKTESNTTATVSTIVTTERIIENQDNGGIVFDTPVAEQSDEELISAALALFQSACKVEWDYTVGSPYELDMNQTVQNQFGWDCYLVTSDGVNSLADVRADYHKIFSENYTDTLDEVFTEANGRVYCLNGSRGADIFYNESVITSVNSRSESEISFTVTNYFSGDDFGNEAYTMDEDFIISIDSDGVWRVNKFRLPY